MFLYRTATRFYACSQKAGLWLFPKKIVESKKFQTVFNAVDLQRYTFHDQIREEVRKELQIENPNFICVFNGRKLVDTDVINEIGIIEGSVISLFFVVLLNLRVYSRMKEIQNSILTL